MFLASAQRIGMLLLGRGNSGYLRYFVAVDVSRLISGAEPGNAVEKSERNLQPGITESVRSIQRVSVWTTGVPKGWSDPCSNGRYDQPMVASFRSAFTFCPIPDRLGKQPNFSPLPADWDAPECKMNRF